MGSSLRKLWIHWRFRLAALQVRWFGWRGRAYHKHLESELHDYQQRFAQENEALFEPAPAVWVEVERRAANLVRQKVGYTPLDYVVAKLQGRRSARMLSLGCGAAGLELMIAEQVPALQIVCVDVNSELLGRAQRAAEQRMLQRVEFEQADLNRIKLPWEKFDLVFCHASLHHLIELEHVAEQIRHTLVSGGLLVLVEIVTRNGYRMWPETRRIARALFQTLPERYRLNHTAYRPEKRVDRQLWEWDTRSAGMECARSEEILPVLRRFLHPVHLVPYYCFVRRFFDTMYGPNYDLSRPLDRAILDWLWELDCYYLDSGVLRGETVFAVFSKAEG